MDLAVIVGGGKIGYFLARSLINRDYEVVLMEKSLSNFRRLQADLGDVVMLGDGCDPLMLKAAGVERSSLLVAATGDDADNLVVSQMAAHCFNCQRIICRINNPANEDLFEALGVTERVSSTATILNLLGQKVGQSPVVLLGNLEHSDLEAVELIVNDDSPFVGMPLGDAQMLKGSIMVAVIHQGNARVASPEIVLQPGDVLIALIPRELESTLREMIV